MKLWTDPNVHPVLTEKLQVSAGKAKGEQEFHLLPSRIHMRTKICGFHCKVVHTYSTRVVQLFFVSLLLNSFVFR